MLTPERVAKICSAIERGETNETAAKLGGIHVSTFCEWLNKYPEFSEAVKRARAAFEDWQTNRILADSKNGLKTLILGQEYEEIKTTYEPSKDGTLKIKSQTKTTKRIPPNATAIIFALCNRDPENWSNKHIQELTGKIETETKPKVSLHNLSDDLLAQVISAIKDGKE